MSLIALLISVSGLCCSCESHSLRPVLIFTQCIHKASKAALLTGSCHATMFGSSLEKSCLVQCFIGQLVSRSGVYSTGVDPFLCHLCLLLFPAFSFHPSKYFPLLLGVLLLTPAANLPLPDSVFVLGIPQWQCVQKDTEDLGHAAGFQVLLWCLAALCLCLTKLFFLQQGLQIWLFSRENLL